MKQKLSIFKLINKIGFEWEAGVNTRMNSDLPDRFVFAYDSSIHRNNYRLHALEIVSPPLEPKEIKEKIKLCKQVVKETNTSMGFHVHVSVNAPYELFANEKFIKFAKDKIKEFADGYKDTKLRDRFDNHYCNINKKIQIERQSDNLNKGSARYRFINFCYGLHTTIEFRIFPSVNNYYKLCSYITLVQSIIQRFYLDEKFKYETKNNFEDSDESEIIKNVVEIPLGIGGDRNV